MYPNLLSIGFGRIALSKFKYRDRTAIVAEILDTIYRDPKGKTKTGIMRAANLNFAQANQYLDHLILCDIVKATDPLRSQEVARYRLTQKGASFLKGFELWHFVLDTFRQKIV
jgi:predicted transcriptional regulator